MFYTITALATHFFLRSNAPLQSKLIFSQTPSYYPERKYLSTALAIYVTIKRRT